MGDASNGTNVETNVNVTANGNVTNDEIICYSPTLITTNGIWQGDNPLDYSLPLFIVQLTLVVLATRIFVIILRPLRQPRVVAEILGGIMLGPTVLGKTGKFAGALFPLRSVMVLETMANIGLLYFLFLVGLEMDIMVIKRVGKQAVATAVAGMILPFAIGAAFSFLLHRDNDVEANHGTYILFLGVALSVTAFPVLARILAELKLINTDLGRIALSSALINDMFAWVLLALAIALADNQSSSLASLWVMLSSAVFVVVCLFAVRPAVSWIISKTPEGESFSDFHICLVLAGVMISGFITDAIGTHAVFGAFVYGLAIPNGPLGMTLVEKLEDFVSGLLLPLFFAISGLRTNAAAIKGAATWGFLFLVIILACIGKIVGTVAVAVYYQIGLREGTSIGLLMNTKGLIEIIVLNVGRDQKVLDDQSFAIMVLITLFMTGLIVPLVSLIYKPSRRIVSYKRRTIQTATKRDSELRMLVCIHSPINVPSIINLLQASNPTRKSPICVYVLHLVELTGRTSAMLIVHNTRKPSGPAVNRSQAQSDHIITAFENLELHSHGVSVQPLTAISPYSTMHEDICNLAEDKRVAFIIIPFHKQQTVDGGMEATNAAFRTINQNLLSNSPCSVGILVDRGLTGSTRSGVNNSQISHRILVLFFGGPDDREALSFAARMLDHQAIHLTLLRFLAGEEAMEQNNAGKERDRKLDESSLKEFKMRSEIDGSRLDYLERVVNNGEETVAAIRSMNDAHDLTIVGRGQGIITPLTAGLTDWSECPELGAIGDLLASSDFATTASVLVVQQYIGLYGDAFTAGAAGATAENEGFEEYEKNEDRLSPMVRSQQMSVFRTEADHIA